jgi:predicted transcriptional regulator
MGALIILRNTDMHFGKFCVHNNITLSNLYEILHYRLADIMY